MAVSSSKKIATTQIKQKLVETDWVALAPGEKQEIKLDGITISAPGDNSGIVYIRRTPRGWVAKSEGIGDSITVSNL